MKSKMVKARVLRKITKKGMIPKWLKIINGKKLKTIY